MLHTRERESSNYFSSSLLLSSLELSDTKVYEPELRALLGSAAHFCKVVDLKLDIRQLWSGDEPAAHEGGMLRKRESFGDG